jgi:hypothetical protein
MRADQRIIREIPLVELWDASGLLRFTRGAVVGVPEITALLSTSGLRFAVAEVGARLEPTALSRALLASAPGRRG